MLHSVKKTKILFVFLGVSIFSILGVAPYFLGPGLTAPVAVGTFLNGNFPDVTMSSQPYRPAFPNLTFNSPLTFTDVPNSNVLFVGQRNGEIYWFENDETVTTKNLLADLSDRVGVVWDGGFLGLAIHPEFGTQGKNYVYMYYTSKDGQGRDYPDAFLSGFGCYQEDYWGGFLYLRRYEVDPVTFTLDIASELTMIKMRMFSCTHRGGSMDFGTDGFLYLATGEQSAYLKPQIIDTNLDGGVLRLDVNEDPALSHPPIRTLNQGRFNDEISGVGYGIPNDNPFLSPSGDNFEEYYTIGHRNPHRMTKDALTGTFYIGEVGESRHEEINVVSKGKNYGWPIYEGNAAGPGANCGVMYNGMLHEAPLVAFPRSEANTIIGGYVYRGTNMPELYGKYICADYGTGEEIWSVDINTGSYSLITSFSPTDIISFGEDNKGELYLLSQGDNVFLYKLVQVNESPNDSAPQLLSQTGAFQDLQTLTPNPGVIPYDLIESFWSDGAEKKRWLVIPNDGSHDTPQEKISFSEDGDWEFPVGSVLIKHFEMPIDELNPSIKRRLETRFSVKASSGHFYFLTYKWNNEQTDAVLLNARLDETIQISTSDGSVRNQTWTYPGTPDCISCHNPATKGTLGPRTRYLNSDMLYPTTGLTANQLVTLSHIGILDESIDDNTVLGYQTYKAIDDSSASLNDRARSYLDLNCAYCHRPGGTGDRAQFDLRLSNDLVQTGLMYANTNTPLGIPGERIVVGGDASKSILYHRTESIDPTIAMPPVAKNLVDQHGLDLIELWINQLDPNYVDPTINASTYIVTNAGSGLVMDIAGVSLANRADVHQWAYAAGASQQFMVTPTGGNYYTLKAVHSNKNVDVEGLGQAPGTNVIQFLENGTDAQLFSFEYLGDAKYAIKAKANGLYLGIENNSTINGGSVKTYPNNGSDFFKWTFTDLLTEAVTGVSVLPENASVIIGGTTSFSASVIPNNATEQDVIWSSSNETIAMVNAAGIVTGISEGNVTITATTVEGAFTDSAQLTVYENVAISAAIYTLTNVGSSLVMDIADHSQDNLADVVQRSSNLNANQQFIVAPATGNYYTIKAVHSNKNVDVQYAGQDPGTNLIQYEENGTDAQLFSLEYLGNEMYAIKSKVNGLYAGIENNSLTNGASVKTYPKDESDFFKWRFTELSITYTYDNGWSPSDPNGVSLSNDSIIINSGIAIISSNTICDDLTINPGAALIINNGITLTALSTNLNSTSTLYSSLIVEGEFIGEVNYKRWVNRIGTSLGGGNDLISSPVANTIFNSAFTTENLNLPENPGKSGEYAFAPYNLTTGAYENYDIGGNGTGAFPLIPGTGYRAATALGGTLTFTGSVIKTNVEVPVSGAVAGKAWNLIGNPYPSYIDAAAFFTTNNIEQFHEEYVAIYGYTGSKNSWKIYNRATIDTLIAPGQGFFVKSRASGGSIQFTPAMRRTGSSDDFILGRQQSALKALSKLKLSNTTENVTTSIYFIEGTTKGLDPGYDAAAYSATAIDFAIFTNLLEDNTGLDIAIQSLPYNDFNDAVVPLGIKAKAGTELSISIDDLSTLPFNINVYLEDTQNNTLTLLNTSAFKFTTTTAINGIGRFNVHYSSKTLSIADIPSADNLRIYTTLNPKSLFITGQLTKATIAKLYDIHGRLVMTKVLNLHTTNNSMDISAVSSGVYFVKLNDENQVKTQKVIIK